MDIFSYDEVRETLFLSQNIELVLYTLKEKSWSSYT